VDLKAAKRILAYLKGAPGYGIGFHKGNQDFVLTAAADSDHASELETRRSTTGYFIFINGTPVAWRSVLQRSVSLSTGEAEWYALSATVQSIIGMRQLCAELGMKQSHPTVIDEDNSAASIMPTTFGPSSKMKHIDIRHHFVREAAANGEISVHQVPTSEQRADILTKNLPRVAFELGRARTMVDTHKIFNKKA
jgi:hypothetical protein